MTRYMHRIILVILFAGVPTRSLWPSLVDEQRLQVNNYKRVCASNASYIAMKMLGRQIKYGDVKTYFEPSQLRGTPIQEVKEFFAAYGVSSVACSVSIEEAAQSKYPFIMLTSETDILRKHSEISHYIVCKALHRDRLQITDAPNDPYEVSTSVDPTKYPCLILNQDYPFVLGVVTRRHWQLYSIMVTALVFTAILIWKRRVRE